MASIRTWNEYYMDAWEFDALFGILSELFLGIWDIRGYESAREFIEDGKKYNYVLKSLKGCNLYKFPAEVCDGGIYIKGIDGFEFVSFDNLLKDYRWEDGKKCGIIDYTTPSISIE